MSEPPVPTLPPVVTKKGWKLIKRLAGGAFSEVYLASNSNFPGKTFAGKVIDLNKVDKLWIERSLKNEMKIMKVMKHPNIVQVHDVTKTTSGAYIFMDFAKYGCLMDELTRTKKPLSEAKAKKYFKDIVKGLSYMHGKGISHRDIKPDNFLIADNERILITDFGFSCVSYDNTEKLMKGTGCGTSDYQAIEIKTKREGEAYDAKAADMYSLGVSLYLMVLLDLPFDPRDESQMIRKQKAEELPAKFTNSTALSKPLKELIVALLDPNPDSRIKIKDVEKHPWLSSP